MGKLDDVIEEILNPPTGGSSVEENKKPGFFDKDLPTITYERYQFYTGIKKRVFYITDEVDELLLCSVGLELLEADKDPSKPITIYINTPGGSIYDGFVLCDIIERLQSPVTIHVLGYAFSMGSYFLMAGYGKENITRKAYPFSTCLIHSGSMILSGTGTQVRDTFNFMEKFEDKIKQYVLSHSKITEEEYKKMDRTEWYMSAEDMLQHGLIDEIV